MRIEEYFNAIRETIDGSPLVQSASVTYDKRSTHIGFVRGDLYLLNGSRLHFREFVDTETDIERYTYAYQYQRENEGLSFATTTPTITVPSTCPRTHTISTRASEIVL